VTNESLKIHQDPLVNKATPAVAGPLICFFENSQSVFSRALSPTVLPRRGNQIERRLSVLHTCGIGLCPLSGLVYDLLIRGGRGLCPNAHCQKSISFQNCDVHCLENTWIVWRLSYHIGGAPFLRYYVASAAW